MYIISHKLPKKSSPLLLYCVKSPLPFYPPSFSPFYYFKMMIYSSFFFLNTDESTLAARHTPVREVGECLSRRPRPGGPGHCGPTRVQLFLGARGPSGHTGTADFPHDLHRPNYIRLLRLDGSSDHVSPGKENLTFWLRCESSLAACQSAILMHNAFQYIISSVLMTAHKYFFIS